MGHLNHTRSMTRHADGLPSYVAPDFIDNIDFKHHEGTPLQSISLPPCERGGGKGGQQGKQGKY